MRRRCTATSGNTGAKRSLLAAATPHAATSLRSAVSPPAAGCSSHSRARGAARSTPHLVRVRVRVESGFRARVRIRVRVGVRQHAAPEPERTRLELVELVQVEQANTAAAAAAATTGLLTPTERRVRPVAAVVVDLVRVGVRVRV